MVQREEIEQFIEDNFGYQVSGNIVRRRTSTRWMEGCVVGNCVGKRGYKTISILGKRLYTHRVLFWMHTGGWPDLIDHIDGDKTNNSLGNLRGSTKAKNALNLKASHKDNSTGLLGVTFRKDTGKFSARFRGKSLGCFATKWEAHKVYVECKANEGTICS